MLKYRTPQLHYRSDSSATSSSTSSSSCDHPVHTVNPSDNMAQPDNQQLLASLHTLAQSQAALLLETKINSLAFQCPTFNSTDTTTFSTWKQVLEKFVPDLAPSELLYLVRRTLTGTALNDFLDHIRTVDGSYKPQTWKEIIDFLRTRFLNPNVAFSLRAGLNAIRFETGEHPSAYRDRLLRHARLIFSDAELAARQQDLIAAYISGIPDRALKLNLIRQGNSTLQAVVDDHINWHTAEQAIQGDDRGRSSTPRQVRFNDEQLNDVRTELHTIANTLERLNIKSIEQEATIKQISHGYDRRDPHPPMRSSRWDRYEEQFDQPPRSFSPSRHFYPQHPSYRAYEYDRPPPYRNSPRSPSPYHSRFSSRGSARGYPPRRSPSPYYGRSPRPYYREGSPRPYSQWRRRSPDWYNRDPREAYPYHPVPRYFTHETERPPRYPAQGDHRLRYREDSRYASGNSRPFEDAAYHQQFDQYDDPTLRSQDCSYEGRSPSQPRRETFRDRTPSPMKRARPVDDDFDSTRTTAPPHRPMVVARRQQSPSVQEISNADDNLDAVASLFANPIEEANSLNFCG